MTPNMAPTLEEQMAAPPQDGLQYVEGMEPALELMPVADRLPATSLWRMYQAWETAKQAENLEMYESAKYYHGKQYTDAELKELKRRRQPPTVKNRIRRKVDFLVGVEQRLRRDPKAFPRNPNGEAAAPVATSVLRAVQDLTKWPAVASECARDALIRGIGVEWAGITRTRKGQIEIKKNHVKGDRFFYDPRSEDWDFQDAQYLGEASWMDIEQAKEMMPWASEAIEQLGEYASGNRSLGALPQLFDKEKNWTQYVDTQKRRLYVVSIWYRYNGEWMWDYLVGQVSLCPEGMDYLSIYIDENDATTHPYKAWSPYVGEDGTRYGMIRDMKPIQDEINKRSSKALHLLTVRQIKYETGSVNDIDKARAELAKPDGMIEINPGKGDAFGVIEQTAQIQGNLELMQEAKAEIENLGPNPGLLGRGVEKQSGRAILAQQNSGMTELSPVFERMREWKLRCYHHDWHLIRKFYTDDRYIRITGDDKAVQHLRINVPVTNEYGEIIGVDNAVAEMDVDIILDEGPDTVTMREELIEALSDRPDIPVEIIIELSSLPDKDAVLKKLAEFKAPPPEVIEMQKRMAQLEELLNAGKVDKQQADTEKVRAETAKVMAETMMPPEAFPHVFPLQYGRSFLDQAVTQIGGPPPGMMPNALNGPPGPEGAPPPPNQLGSPNDFTGSNVPQGEVDPDYLSQMAPYPDPTMATEPQLGERGGLPLGPM